MNARTGALKQRLSAFWHDRNRRERNMLMAAAAQKLGAGVDHTRIFEFLADPD